MSEVVGTKGLKPKSAQEKLLANDYNLPPSVVSLIDSEE